MKIRKLLFSAVVLAAFIAGIALPRKTSAAVNFQAYAGSGIGNGFLAVSKYYPQTITVDEGDSITWTVQGDAHTISFLSGAPAPSPLSPDAQKPSGGNTYGGSGFVNSGIISPGGTYILTFTKSGTYTYNCLLHPGMTATVVVQTAGAPYPYQQRHYRQNYLQEKAADISSGLRVLSEVGSPQPKTESDGSRTFFNTAGIGNGISSVLRFFPQTEIISAGDSVTWTNKDPMMPHTVTFAGTDGNFPDIFTPAGGKTYDGSAFTSSGVLLPNASYSLKFTKAGRYSYECLLHDELGMRGEIIVMPKR